MLCPSAACAYETQIVGKLSDLTDKIASGVSSLECAAAKLSDAADVIEESAMIRDSVIPAMESLRAACDEAVRLLREKAPALEAAALSGVTAAAKANLARRAGEAVSVEMIMFSKEYGVLGSTENAGEYISLFKEN